MTPELIPLCLAVLLQMVQVGLYSRWMTRENGVAYNLSPRDTEPKLGQIAGRLRRAASNHAEALVLFAIAVLALEASGKSSALTAGAAWVYLIARCLYVPAYAYGWMPWCSVFFLTGTLSTVVILAAVLL